MSKVARSIAVGVLLVAVATAGFVLGRQSGETSARNAVAEDYNMWSISLMNHNPDLDLYSITLVHDGELIPKPACASATQPYLRLARRPDTHSRDIAEIVDIPEKGSWAAKIPTDGGLIPPVAAAVVGCFKKKQVANS